MYDNCRIYSPNGELMGFVDKDRYDWYLKKNLAVALDEKSIKLNFIPKNYMPWNKNEYLHEERKSICVVCGTSDELSKHHVVPTRYRKHFPVEIKSHSSFDVLPLCEKCHTEYENHSNDFSKELVVKNGLENAKKEYKQKLKDLGLVATYINKGDELSEENKNSIMEKIKVKFNRPDLTVEDLPKILEDNNDFLEGFHTILNKRLVDIYGHIDFIRMWRKHFVEKSKPKFLAESWIRELDTVQVIVTD